jgi:hypothetical protein
LRLRVTGIIIPPEGPFTSQAECANRADTLQPLRACRAGRVRLDIERLEDRDIPGQTLNAILFWQTGLFPIGDLLGTQVTSELPPASASQSNTDTTTRTPLDSWIVQFPPSDTSPAGDEFPSESARTTHAVADYSTPTNDGGSAPFSWSPELTEPATRQLATTESSAAPIVHAPAAVPPSAWAPPAVLGGVSDQGSLPPDVGAAGAGSDLQITPAAGGDAAAETMFQKGQSTGNPHGGGTPAGYSPTQMRHAYGFDHVANDGLGQTIAIVDAFDAPNIASDLDTFSRQFGLPTTSSGLFTFSKVYAQGIKPSADGGWA